MSGLDSLAAQLEELDAAQAQTEAPGGKRPKQEKLKREKREKGKKKKGGKKAVVALVLLVVLLLGLIGGGLWYFLVYSAKSPLAREEDALGGLLAGLPQEDWGAALDDVVEEGQVLLGIAAEPVFEYNGQRGRIGIENDEANQYSFQVTITEDATGDVLYESGLIDPGYYIEYIELNKMLPAGDYPATAVFTTYSLEESPDPIAEIKANLTLHVTDGQFYW